MVGRKEDLTYIENALGEDTLRVILLHAPGGHGKESFSENLVRNAQRVIQEQTGLVHKTWDQTPPGCYPRRTYKGKRVFIVSRRR